MTALTHENFSKTLNTIFRIQIEGLPAVELELTTVSELLLSMQQERFSIVFRGPAEPFLGQGIQRLEHDELKSIDLFLVPVGRNEGGTLYEAVFNRFRGPVPPPA